MPDIGFHFAYPWALLALLAPLPVWLWLRYTAPRHDTQRYQAYADAHLLPHLLGVHTGQAPRLGRRLLGWGLLWSLMCLALAGPRWDYTDMQLFHPGSDLVILLDLSQSMDVADVQPSRLARARQEIEDLIVQNRQTRIGLIGFASVAHVISPLTDDASAIRQQLPAISTDLIQLKGSRLSEAVTRGMQMLAGQPTDSEHHLLLISDGDFGETDFSPQIEALSAAHIRLHTLGVGTSGGGPVVITSVRRALLDSKGQRVISRLDAKTLQTLAEATGGIYQEATFSDADTAALAQQLAKHTGKARAADEKTRVWNERYHWLLLPTMLLLLGHYRRRGARLTRPQS